LLLLQKHFSARDTQLQSRSMPSQQCFYCELYCIQEAPLTASVRNVNQNNIVSNKLGGDLCLSFYPIAKYGLHKYRGLNPVKISELIWKILKISDFEKLEKVKSLF